LVLLLREGSIRVSFAWLVRLFTPAWMHETRVVALRYHLDETSRASSLVAVDVRRFPAAHVAAKADSGSLAIDVRDPAFPAAVDVRADAGGLDLTAIRGRWNDAAATATAERILRDPAAALAQGVIYRAEMAYDLEQRTLGQVRLWLGLPAAGMAVEDP
jgi:hypothetical protein